MPDTPAITANPREAQWTEWPLTALEGGCPTPGLYCVLPCWGPPVWLSTWRCTTRCWASGQRMKWLSGSSGRLARLHPARARFVKRASRRAPHAAQALGGDRRSAIRQVRPPAPGCRWPGGDRFIDRGGSADGHLLRVPPPDQLPKLASYSLAGVIGSVVIALFYTILFWLLLSLVYIGIRSGRAQPIGRPAPHGERLRPRAPAAVRQVKPGAKLDVRRHVSDSTDHHGTAHSSGRRLVGDRPVGAVSAGPVRAAVGSPSADHRGARRCAWPCLWRSHGGSTLAARRRQPGHRATSRPVPTHGGPAAVP